MATSFVHETVVEMFRHRPALAAELLTGLLGVAVPEHREARIGAAEVVELRPAEHRADTVVVLSDPPGPVGAVVVEVQLRPDDDKPWVWPEYIAGVRRRVRGPTVLMVFCGDTATAAWAASPIELGGPGFPGGAADRGTRADPGPADARRGGAHAGAGRALGTGARHRRRRPYAALDSLVVALDEVHTERAVEYARLVLSELPALARGYLEELMSTETYEYESEFTRRLEARGEVRGRALMLLRQLEARGLAVSADAHERITTCTDSERLDAWAVRVLTAGTVEELFA